MTSRTVTSLHAFLSSLLHLSGPLQKIMQTAEISTASRQLSCLVSLPKSRGQRSQGMQPSHEVVCLLSAQSAVPAWQWEYWAALSNHRPGCERPCLLQGPSSIQDFSESSSEFERDALSLAVSRCAVGREKSIPSFLGCYRGDWHFRVWHWSPLFS